MSQEQSVNSLCTKRAFHVPWVCGKYRSITCWNKRTAKSVTGCQTKRAKRIKQMYMFARGVLNLFLFFPNMYIFLYIYITNINVHMRAGIIASLYKLYVITTSCALLQIYLSEPVRPKCSYGNESRHARTSLKMIAWCVFVDACVEKCQEEGRYLDYWPKPCLASQYRGFPLYSRRSVASVPDGLRWYTAIPSDNISAWASLLPGQRPFHLNSSEY